MVFNFSLYDWNRLSGYLFISGAKCADYSQQYLDFTGVWNSDGFSSLVLVASEHRPWFCCFEITK